MARAAPVRLVLAGTAGPGPGSELLPQLRYGGRVEPVVGEVFILELGQAEGHEREVIVGQARVLFARPGHQLLRAVALQRGGDIDVVTGIGATSLN